MNYTPDMNDGEHIFVFGSNLLGRHGAGAAREAKLHWRARYGNGVGRTGNAYAIPTKDEYLEVLPLDRIATFVASFISYAKLYEEFTFLVTKIGCGLAGYEEKQIAPMFADCHKLSNVMLPEGW